MQYYIVAIPKENEYNYEWIASFETEEAAASYAIKIENAIIVKLGADFNHSL